ncbi:MAG: hypothetical protein JWM44_1346 [Bacilli bacterium]|nr:hypothetical protein [Bacilli bacterium]
MIEGLKIWGMPAYLYVTFIILMSFAAFAVILDKNGYVSVDDDGNESSILRQLLLLGTGISGFFLYIFMLYYPAIIG